MNSYLRNNLKHMTKLIIMSILFLISLEAQEQKIYGLIDNGTEKFIITENGIIKSENDAYLEYYRKIYGDSTIINPNTILNSKSMKIIPLINPNDWSNLNFEIAPQVYFYDFLEHDSTGSIIISPDISQYLQNYSPPSRTNSNRNLK